jgi:hypothetical protein
MSLIRDSTGVGQHLVNVIYPDPESIEVMGYHRNGATRKVVLGVPANAVRDAKSIVPGKMTECRDTGED